MELLRIIMGRRLRAARERAGLTQKDVAIKIGCISQHIGQLERGERPIPASILVRLPRILGCDITDIVPESAE